MWWPISSAGRNCTCSNPPSRGCWTLRLTADKLFGGQRGDESLAEIAIPEYERGGWQVEADFVAAIRREREVTHTTFADGLHYMQFTDAVARSLNSGRAEVV